MAEIACQPTRVLTITNPAPNLGPIDVIFLDHKPGSGRLIVRCYSQAWTAWWGAMGDHHTVRTFVLESPADYVAGALLYGPGDLQRARPRKLQSDYVERIVRAIQDALRAEAASPQAPSPQAVVGEASELKGTFACPICGQDTPHGHSDEVVAAYRDDQVRRDGFTSCAVTNPRESGWYLCTGVEVPDREGDSQRWWFKWVRSYMQGYGRCDDIPEVLYWSADMQHWYLRNALGNAIVSGAENRRPVAVNVQRWRDITALTPSPAPSASPHQGADALREALAWKWGYEYLQSRMESIGRKGWAHDCDEEIQCRIGANK